MMTFECGTCGEFKDRTGFHRDRKAKHGIKVFRCRDCYRVAGSREREVKPLTRAECKVLNRWLRRPLASTLYKPVLWGYDVQVPYGLPDRV